MRKPIRVTSNADDMLQRYKAEPSSPLHKTDELPPLPVIEAGLKKFYELAQIWRPGKTGDFSEFDYRKREHLSIVLALTYQEMRKVEHQK